MSYVFRKGKAILFSGGTQAAVFAWNINLFFASEYTLRIGDPGYQPNQDAPSGGRKGPNGKEVTIEQQKKEYITYRAEHTPWFVYDFIQCL